MPVPGWDNFFTSLVVLGALAINIVGSRVVDRAQTAIVVGAARGVRRLHRRDDHRGRLEPAGLQRLPGASDIIASVALTFFAYLGFSVITFTVGDLRDPARELPRAMNIALCSQPGCTS